jgi:hypothetical protein
VKDVPWCDEGGILDAMEATDAKQYRRCLGYFQEPFLSTVQRTEPSMIDLTPPQIQFLIGKKLFAPADASVSTSALRMHIFLVPEVMKRRCRLIVHTVDVNNATEDPGGDTNFVPLQDMIEEMPGVPKRHQVVLSFLLFFGFRLVITDNHSYRTAPMRDTRPTDFRFPAAGFAADKRHVVESHPRPRNRRSPT